MSTSAPCFRFVGGRLFIEGAPAERIARAVGTPAYVYSSGEIRRRFAELRSAFGRLGPLLCYALKANPNLSVCRLLARLGAGAEVVSGGELRRALEAGFKPGRIVFSGVGKTEPEIACAVKTGILALIIESEEELDAVTAVARRLRRRARVMIRVNPGVDARTHRHVATGLAGSKFGVAPAAASRLCLRAAGNPRLELVGLHCHIGSQVTRVAPYRTALARLLKIAGTLARRGAALRFLDVGGGLGVSYGSGRPLPLARLARELARGLGARPGPRLILEPGRYLTADAGLLLTRVLYRKRASGRRCVILDAGMNDLLRPALYGSRHPVLPAASPGRARARLDAAGPVCESADSFGRGLLLPWPEPGELWAILKAGAYGFSMSSQYNSRLRPPEVLVEGKKWRVVRVRETYEDLLRHER